MGSDCYVIQKRQLRTNQDRPSYIVWQAVGEPFKTAAEATAALREQLNIAKYDTVDYTELEHAGFRVKAITNA